MPTESRERAREPKTIHEELRRLEPFRSRGHEALLALLRTADMAKNRFSTLFEEKGVTFQQYNVLRILRAAGPQGLPTLEIADRMIERTPGVTRIVDRLEGKGWVERERCTEDRRKVWCRITGCGLDLMASLDGPIEHADEETFSVLDEHELDTMIRSLDVLRAQMA